MSSPWHWGVGQTDPGVLAAIWDFNDPPCPAMLAHFASGAVPMGVETTTPCPGGGHARTCGYKIECSGSVVQQGGNTTGSLTDGPPHPLPCGAGQNATCTVYVRCP